MDDDDAGLAVPLDAFLPFEAGAALLGGAGPAEPGPRDGEVVNYVFPVEVVLVGGLGPRERALLQAELYQDLQDAVNRRLA